MVADRYYKVKLVNGDILNFGKRCDAVDYKHPVYAIFKETINPASSSYRTLAIIPHSTILAMTVHEKEES